MDLIREFWEFLKERKKLWLVPLLLIFMIFGLLIIFGEGTAVAPFIYTLF